MNEPKKNTAPPDTRCSMCGGRGRWDGLGLACKGDCPWSSFDPRMGGLTWRLKVLLGKR